MDASETTRKIAECEANISHATAVAHWHYWACYCKKTLKTPGLSELVNNCNNNLPVGVNISVNYCYDDGVACKCCSQLLL